VLSVARSLHVHDRWLLRRTARDVELAARRKHDDDDAMHTDAAPVAAAVLPTTPAAATAAAPTSPRSASSEESESEEEQALGVANARIRAIAHAAAHATSAASSVAASVDAHSTTQLPSVALVIDLVVAHLNVSVRTHWRTFRDFWVLLRDIARIGACCSVSRDVCCVIDACAGSAERALLVAHGVVGKCIDIYLGADSPLAPPPPPAPVAGAPAVPLSDEAKKRAKMGDKNTSPQLAAMVELIALLVRCSRVRVCMRSRLCVLCDLSRITRVQVCAVPEPLSTSTASAGTQLLPSSSPYYVRDDEQLDLRTPSELTGDAAVGVSAVRLLPNDETLLLCSLFHTQALIERVNVGTHVLLVPTRS
jgi:hypothetical protein